MKVAIVGAGLSGLAAARTLKASGIEAVVFESDTRVGGRILTKTIGEYVFDAGATSVSPMGRSIEAVMLHELSTTDLVRIEKPVSAHDGIRVVSGSVMGSKSPRYCYRQGLDQIAKLLQVGLDVRLGSAVECVEPGNESEYRVNGQPFDAVVLSVPVPLAEKILARSRDRRRFSNARFRSCLSVLLGYDFEFDSPYHALVGPDQSLPLAWVSFESVKSPDRAPPGHSSFVAQLSAEYSRRRFNSDDDLILEETLGDMVRLLGKKFASPQVANVVRFEFSHPETTTAFESVNSQMSRLLIAGDGLLGGRTELAYETGIRAANLLIESPK